MERKAVSQRASRPFGVPQLSMKRAPINPRVVLQSMFTDREGLSDKEK